MSLDPCALRFERLARLKAELKRRELPAILLFDAINVRYATGMTNMQVWTLHNKCRYAFVGVEGPVILFDFGNAYQRRPAVAPVDEVRPAISHPYFISGDRQSEWLGRWAAEIADLVRRHGGGDRRLAYDRLDPPAAALLQAAGVQLIDGDSAMEHARAIKGTEELTAIRSAIAGCEAAMARMRRALQPGMTELAVWSVLHQANIELGGEWIETRLLTSGPRTNPWYQESSDRIIEPGDLVSFDTDLIGRYGYCADLSRSWVAGDGPPDGEQRALFELAEAQLWHNLDLVQPGISLREFTERSFRLPEDCIDNRYSVLAHGVGLTDEWPAILPREDAAFGGDGVLEPGMTLCVEALVGRRGRRESVKLEEQVLVTEAGHERLSTYPLGLRG
jgi:Xaa-Pro aminopeptidase